MTTGQDGKTLVSRRSKPTRWIGVHTAVNPGSAIQFVSRDEGWRLDGVYGAPWLDDNLTTGPGGAELDWPARSISETTNGGVSWTKVVTLVDGIWSLDFQSPQNGWVVGVDALLRTTDGGGMWEHLPEPADGPLISVQFETAADGGGVTMSGAVVRTDDGGMTWARTGLATTVDAICATPTAVVYAASGNGALYVSRDDGDSWQQVESAHEPAGDNAWPYLACSDAAGVLGILDLGKVEAGASESYTVQQGGASGSPWRTTLTESDPPTVRTAGSGQPPAIATLAGIAESASGPIVVGLPQTGFDTAVQSLSSAGTANDASAATASTPSLQAMPSSSRVSKPDRLPEDFLRVLGQSFVGENGWLYIVDSAVGSANPDYRTIVEATTDGGTRWRIVNEGPIEQQPQYR